MGYANEAYCENNIQNYYLLTFLGSVLGEAMIVESNVIAFADHTKEYNEAYVVYVYEDYVNIVDDAEMLDVNTMYQIIGYCQFQGIEYKINEWKDAKELLK